MHKVDKFHGLSIPLNVLGKPPEFSGGVSRSRFQTVYIKLSELGSEVDSALGFEFTNAKIIRHIKF